MIYGISGKPGAGKSYEAVVTHLLPIVTKDKRKVVTNLPINIDRFCSIYGDFCRDLIEVVDGQFHNYGGERPFSKKDHYLQYENWENEKGQKVYFFIDECHLAMPTQGTEKELTEFYSMHRHYGFDIMLITQNFRKVNRDIKDMGVNHYRCIKKSMLGQDHKYILKVHDGASSSNQSVVATHERAYNKKYFDFYQSHTKSKTSVDEATSNDIAKWYSHWSFKASAVLFLFVIFILTKTLASDEKPFANLAPKPKNQTTNQSQPPEQQLNQNQNSVNQSQELADQPQPQQQTNVVAPLIKTRQHIEYEKMVENSKSFHPFYKVKLSISGYAEFIDFNRQTSTHYFSASQNGQHIFSIKTKDLLLAGYEVRSYSECSVRIKYYEYEDWLTCNAPTQGASFGGNDSTQVE